jgi:hypothetical protein
MASVCSDDNVRVLYPALISLYVAYVDGDSVVGEVNRDGLDGTGVESWWIRYFSHPSRPVLGPT